jgi:hypothetical protein
MNTPGLSQSVPTNWPEDAGLSRVPGESHLLVFIHLQCPCSKATLSNLKSSLNESIGRHQVTIIFSGTSESAGRNGRMLVAKGTELGAAMVHDHLGTVTRRFRIKTSGHVLLYDGTGALVYSGGVTAGRGVSGPSGGQRSIEQHMLGETIRLREHVVYGCPILEEVSCETDCCSQESDQSEKGTP